MKYFKSIFITFTILLSASTFASAITYKCPGEQANITWSSANIQGTTCNFLKTNNDFQAQAGSITPENANTAATGAGFIVQTGGTITLSCPGHEPVTDELKIKNLGQCGMCPAGQVPNNTTPGSIYSGNGCITPTATIVGGSCTIPVGQSSCNVPVTFSTTYVNNPGLFNVSAPAGSYYYNGSLYSNGQSFITGSRTEANVTVGGGTPVMLGVREMSDTRNTFVVSGSIKGENCDVAFGESTRTTPISWTSAGGTGAEVLQVQASC